MIKKKILVMSFIDPAEKSGATNRLTAIISRYEDIYDIDVLHLFSDGRKRFQQLWRKSKKISETSENHSLKRQLKSFFRSLSFLSNRVAVLDELIFDDYENIICHTNRTFLALSPVIRKKVIHIDVCDNLVRGYKRSSFYFFKTKPLLGVAYLYESILEYFVLKLIDGEVSLSFITRNDVPSWLNNQDRVFCFPNPYHLASVSNDSSVHKNTPMRIGLVGNFRTILNNQILKSLLKYQFPFEREIVLFGQCPIKEMEYADDVKVYGEFEDLECIKDLFDVGYCCSPLQAGIQNKVIDYLFLNKPILIDNAVYTSFLNDEFYKILMESPFVFRDASLLTCFNCDEKSQLNHHIAVLRKFVTMNEFYLKTNLHKVVVKC